MKAEITANATEIKKGDTALYSVLITPEKQLKNLKVEIIPTAENFPDMYIIPDTKSVTVSNGLTYTADISDIGVFEIDIPSINSHDIITVSFSAQASSNFDKNTTAVIVSSDNNGSTYEAYAQTTVNGYSLPTAIPVICSLVFVFASALLLRHIVKRII